MQEGTTASVAFPSSTAKDVMTEILREGAQQMLATAIEAEVAEWIESHAHLKDRERPPPGRSQRLPAGADHHDGSWEMCRCGSRGSTIVGRTEKRRSSPRRFCRRTCGRPRASRT